MWVKFLDAWGVLQKSKPRTKNAPFDWAAPICQAVMIVTDAGKELDVESLKKTYWGEMVPEEIEKDDPWENYPKFKVDLEEKFECEKCGETGALVREITTGGKSKMEFLDFERMRFIIVSCKYCGKTDFYNSEILFGNDKVANAADFLLRMVL